MGLGESARRRDLVELRIANLRRELDAETEPRAQAAILYQVGALYEHELAETSDAVEQYERACAAAPGFQPALIARLRIAERGENGHDLDALRSEQVARSTSPAVSGAALLDLAMQSEDWASLLREAISRSAEPAVPALILEWLADARDDEGAVRDALLAQAKAASDPTLGAALWIDLALHELTAGRPDDAIAALEHASGCDALDWQARSLQARTAREHERWDVFVRAVTALAGLLEAALESGDAVDPLSLPIPEGDRRPRAAHLWQEAATCSLTHLDDADAAAGYLSSVLRWMPGSRMTRLQSLKVAELRGDAATVESESEWFRTMAPEEPAFLSHELRLAGSIDDLQSGLGTLRDLAERFPESGFARASLDVALIRGERHTERAAALHQHAELADGETQAQFAWRAAQLNSPSANGSDDAQALYSEAIEASTTSDAEIIREAMGAAMRDRQMETVLTRCQQLLNTKIEPDERASLSYFEYDLTRHRLRSDQRAEQLLREALGDANNHGWAPSLARARAAWEGDLGLLAQAHEESAKIASGDRRLGHLCAAGQAHARERNWDAAERVLRTALATAPDDGFVVSLLDAVLREGGHPEDVVSLARERSKADSRSALGELSLLLAGSAAERSGNPTAARQAYAQALADAPGSTSGALALLDLSRCQRDESGTGQAYRALSDSRLGGGVPELFALLLGDNLGTDDGVAAGQAFELALQHPSTAAAAAIAILSLPVELSNADQRAAAEELLSDAGATAPADANGFARGYGALRASLGEKGSSAGDAWLQLSAAAPSEGLRAATLLQGLRASAIARGTDAADELFMRAQEAETLADRHPDAAVAIDEALTPTDDATLRVHAFAQKLQHSDVLGRGSLEAAHCRALVEANRGAEAIAFLSKAIDERPDDLALWETLRTAAWQAREWPMVAQACERLAPFVEDSLRGDLLEEAGVVRMDCLQQYQQAEDLFRRALEDDPARDLAFRRLRDLFVAREDAEALEVLVAERLALGGPKDRPALLYERARLLRGFSDRPGALEVLDELFTTDPDHAGALALAAEVHVSLERWAEAVDCLQRLSRANIPDEQRRVAHLGAAGFLEGQLGAKAEALEELRAVEALGLADAENWTRIAALEAELGHPEAATEAYRSALEAEPSSADAIAGLVALVDGTQVDSAVASYEAAVWSQIEAGELAAPLLEALRNAAQWRGHHSRAAGVVAVQRALGLASQTDDPSVDLSHVSVAALWDPKAGPLLQDVVLRVGPALGSDRLRTKKADPTDRVVTELERMSQRFGARTGSVETSNALTAPIARTGRDGEIRWVVPQGARGGLDPNGLFCAGRLAWAAPHGGAQLVDGSPEQAAGILLAVLRVSRCEVEAGDPPLPAVDVKLRRAARKAVSQAVGGAKLHSSSLLAYARSLQRSADRAGLLACGEIGAALSVLLKQVPNIEALSLSSRGLDLLRFWLDADSPLWGHHG